jgi:uncharacterized membrane protein
MRKVVAVLAVSAVIALILAMPGCGGVTGTDKGVSLAGKPPGGTAQYYATELPLPSWAYSAFATAVSDVTADGVVWVGGAGMASGGGYGAMLWRVAVPPTGAPTSVTPIDLHVSGQVNGVNSRGEAVGSERMPASDFQAFYSDGSQQVTLLPQLGSIESNAYAIGEDASTVRIAGYVYTAGGSAALWEFPVGSAASEPLIVAPVDGVKTSLATGLCDAGQPLRVIGTLWDGGAGLPVLWERPLGGALTPTRLGAGGRPTDVNAGGQICGPGARVWQGGTSTQLPLLSGYASQSANSISNSGVVVGMAETAPKKGTVTRVAVRWQSGQVADLNTLVTGLPGSLYRANGINSRGMIVADSSAAQKTYLLTPK